MRLHLLIGPSGLSTQRFRTMLKKKRQLLEKIKVVSPEWNHIRVYMACSDPDQVGLVRYVRGFADGAAQEALYRHLHSQLEQTLDRAPADKIVLSSGQLGGLMTRPAELERLKSFLTAFTDDIRITVYLCEQTRLMLPLYEEYVMDGRANPLTTELGLTSEKSWWDASLAMQGENVPELNQFNHIQYPAQWMDYERLIKLWEDTFGQGSVSPRPLDLDYLNSENASTELAEILEIEDPLGVIDPDPGPPVYSAVTIARARQMNDVLLRYGKAQQISIPMDMWKSMAYEVRRRGPAMQAGELHRISDYFKPMNARLIKAYPQLEHPCFTPPEPVGDGSLTEVGTQMGFRASQYLTAARFRIDRNSPSLEEKRKATAESEKIGEKLDVVLEPAADQKQANTDFAEMLKVNHRIVLSTHIRPHNDLGRVKEDEEADPYNVIKPRKLKKGSSGNVIVGCMKNEAPYIIEWVAYHRAIGVDKFLIYTNDCTDGTAEILDRLQQMGVVEHRNNDNWKGNSPQQHALNQAQKEQVIIDADWIIHIDVDEFMNVRVGNGTLDDLFAAVPDATNIAMTWRLFGHNGVTKLNDDFVIEQFDTCAPKYCPKPHTVWGFKTMFQNLGAYKRFSCHRPNQLQEGFEDKVRWINGSGDDITASNAKNGWRSSKKTIGYDLIQLNHYALRSAESFLIKRQRGRALHVDRSIGINYWIRMDWSDFRDVTIKRNVPRLRAAYDALMADKKLSALHKSGLAWHRAKADELHETPEFQELYSQALKVKLTESERVAYALALDMES